MPPEEVEANIEFGTQFVEHSMDCIDVQLAKSNKFYYEHPAGAGSWKLHRVEETSATESVHTVVFDQCMTGLKTPVSHIHMRKRTRVMTNSLKIVQALADKRCNNQHEHRRIQGAENGISLARWAQTYPPELCSILVSGIMQQS